MFGKKKSQDTLEAVICEPFEMIALVVLGGMTQAEALNRLTQSAGDIARLSEGLSDDAIRAAFYAAWGQQDAIIDHFVDTGRDRDLDVLRDNAWHFVEQACGRSFSRFG